MAGRRFRVLAATIALGFAIALILGAAGIGKGTKALGASTTLTVLSGDVTVRHGNDPFTTAVDGEVLNQGDAIKTGLDGRAVLTYFEGSSVTIEPSTELAIDAASASADGGTVVTMTQAVGRTWHVVSKLITSGSKYEVRTPASTASVRGTEFQVDSDSASTTLATTEGTVVAQVADPGRAGATVEVPVTAGTVHLQQRNAPPAPSRPAPEPERKVVVSVGASNSLVVDPAGRSNGVTKDGKLVAQTPGAQVPRDGDRIVVTLPNLPDGKLGTHVEKKSNDDDTDVDVETKVEEQGKLVDVDTRTIKAGDRKRAGVEIKRDSSGAPVERVLTSDETRALPTPHANTQNTRRTVAPAAPASTTSRPSATQRPDPTRAPTPTRRAEGTPDKTVLLARTVAPLPPVTPRPRG